MDQQRQKAFQKLRPACVGLSAIALKFRGHQVPTKDVLHALEGQNQVLQNLGLQNQLDEKLAEYAFFPLTHVFNESQRLSSTCMQCAVQSVTILVSKGWRLKLAPAVGKQLLILMSLLAGSHPQRQQEPPSDELKCAAFECMQAVIRWLSRSPTGTLVLQDQSTRNVVDQLAYQLVDALTEAVSDEVQLAAANALQELNLNITNRVFLASLLPRTVSSLTRALKPSTHARRTRKVLITDLKLLGTILNAVLADEVTNRSNQDESEEETLDDSWLKATTSQVKNALAQVCKLRTHDHVEVRLALFDLCLTLVDKCSKTLKDSFPVLVETMVVLVGTIDDDTAKSRLENVMSIYPDIAEILKSSFHTWSQTLPRVMQGSDDKPKTLMLSRIVNAFDLLTDMLPGNDRAIETLCSAVLKSVTAAIDTTKIIPIQPYSDQSDQYLSLARLESGKSRQFGPVLFDHQSQRDSTQMLQTLIERLRQHPSAGKIIHTIIDTIPNCTGNEKVASTWLAVSLLQGQSGTSFELDDILEIADEPGENNTSRAFLVQDLYTYTKDMLLESSPYIVEPQLDHRIIALAIESVVLQAQQFGSAYRVELYETLYPIIALLSSRDNLLRSHAMTALNRLTSYCDYTSVSSLLIENADYLVNSVAWKLNTFNLSPEAPAVLNMIVRLVGAKVIPYLDDLIASIFSALDSYHGYPQWVEMLFEVLRTMVDESVKSPELAMSNQPITVHNKRLEFHNSTVENILDNLKARKRRTIASGTATNVQDGSETAPHRPWTKQQDDPNFKPDPTEGKDIETLLREAEAADEENELPAPKEPEQEEDPTKPLSKSHELLLKIARATVPHLSNPSSKVRLILLQLLGQISPLLARHENTFLPLVNVVWPSVIQRLFAEIIAITSDTEEHDPRGEKAYNVAAAADVVAGLCETAGDFMSSRVEQIFPQLQPLYSKTWKEVEGRMARNQKRQAGTSPTLPIEDTTGKNIKGTVDLHITNSTSSTMTPSAQSKSEPSSNALSTILVSGFGQVFASLTHLLINILKHVRVTTEIAGEIFSLLTPLLDYPGAIGQNVTDALEQYNSDAVWVLRIRRKGESEIARGERAMDNRVWREVEMPKLRKRVGEMQMGLRPIVF